MSCQAGFYAQGRGGPWIYIVWSTAFIAIKYTKEQIGGHGARKPVICSTSWHHSAEQLRGSARGADRMLLKQM
eukprot:9451011-Heterocapsa_arctica.AAC.1